jgi:predicted AlkP superfamily phosphohydrolase/phosphomutase
VRTRTLWSILSNQGLSVGIINWPLTYPAPSVRGYLISDAYARLAQTPSAIDDPALLYPPELRLETLENFRELAAEPLSVLPAGVDVESRHREPGKTDLVNGRLADALQLAHPAAVNVMRYQSLDPIGHYFLRYAEPAAFGDVSEEERRALGSVLQLHYAMVDDAIGRAIARLGADDLLLVVSAYGMEPLGLGRRLVERLAGDRDLSGAHEGAPDGFLMAYGPSVAKARSRPRASVLDVVPTVLYFLGLPIGRDMDGFARTDIFQASFTENRPLTFIPTYDR